MSFTVESIGDTPARRGDSRDGLPRPSGHSLDLEERSVKKQGGSTSLVTTQASMDPSILQTCISTH